MTVSERPIRVALVGCGYWGPNLARNLHQIPETELTACCDVNEQTLEKMGRLYPNTHLTTDFASICRDQAIDAVVIATPPRTHHALAKAALESGKHVLVEKPLTLNSRDAEDLIGLAEAQNRVLMVGHVFQYNPAVRYIKQIIEEGKLGELYYLYSTRVNLGRVQSDINALWSIAPHDISILLYLLETEPEWVSARGATYLTDGIEDVVFINLGFPGGILAHVHVSWLDPSKVRRMTIVGSKQMVVYDDVADEGKVKLYEKGVYRKEEPGFGEFQYRVHSGMITIPRLEMTEPLRAECQHFATCIREGQQPETDGLNGLQVVRILEAAQESLERGGAAITFSLP
ncbi:MAG: Gfo/Idh/MocA family oxidoreductase [Anaerolineae bacterium]|nr:Gfo/Idh/MocA family oxidoreductase [Anaerolineae bacterium]